MSQFKLEFTLKQQTPIIHFQSEQKGATLRATELKPKLDRFLLKHSPQLKKYARKHPNGDLSFDYKVGIKVKEEVRKTLPNHFLFFANNPKKTHQKTFMIQSSTIQIDFFSFNHELIDTIKAYFYDFMLISNFGSRSSKGYGSFHIPSHDIEKRLKKYFPMVFKLNEKVNATSWENKVDTIHKRLKAGINFKIYKKSLLFNYMCSKNLRWEKRKIKECFPSLATGKPPIDCDVKREYRYIRAMLGLTGINEYKGHNTVTIKHKNKIIERFKSPIQYKIINEYLYLLGDRSYEMIMGKIFEFEYRGKKFDIQTPSKNEFDLYEFLKFVEKETRLIIEVK